MLKKSDKLGTRGDGSSQRVCAAVVDEDVSGMVELSGGRMLYGTVDMLQHEQGGGASIDDERWWWCCGGGRDDMRSVVGG